MSCWWYIFVILVTLMLEINGTPSWRRKHSLRHLRHYSQQWDRESLNEIPLGVGEAEADRQRRHNRMMSDDNMVYDVERRSHVQMDQAVVDYDPLRINDSIRMFERQNCSSCIGRFEARHVRMEKIKQDILAKLGLKFPPNINGSGEKLPQMALQHLQNEYFGPYVQDGPSVEFAADEEDDSAIRAKTEKIYVFAVKPPSSLNIPNNADVAYFRFSGDTKESALEHAHLHVYIRPPRTFQASDTFWLGKIDLYKIIDPENVENLQRQKLVSTKEFKHALRTGHWDRFSVVQIVREWFEKPDRNYGLMVRVQYQDENLAVHPGNDIESVEHNMYIDLVTKEGAKSRRKREVLRLDCQEGDQEKRCCRYPLVVDFEKFGWDWVIAPKRYKAYYCAGECPFQHVQQYLHTHVAHNMGVGPCCTPADMADILMIYFNEQHEVLVSKVPGMVVTRCGCA